MPKVPEYTKRAIATYQAKFDRININLEKGLKDRFRAVTSESLNAFVNRTVKSFVETEEKKREPAPLQYDETEYTIDPDLPFS